jgi:hypothetical protein
MFEGWDDFYLLIGSAGGALIGLLFVVVTLTNGGDRDQTVRSQRLFMTPNVVHFGVVVVASAAAMAPGLPFLAEAAVIGGAGLVGLVYAAWVALHLFKGDRVAVPDWSDPWWYGVAPAAAYAALVAAALAVAAGRHGAVYAVAAVVTSLLIIGIRNAWDLVTWLAPRAEAKD